MAFLRAIFTIVHCGENHMDSVWKLSEPIPIGRDLIIICSSYLSVLYVRAWSPYGQPFVLETLIGSNRKGQRHIASI